MKPRPVISTTLVTHNRLALTRRTLEAYMRSTTVPFELVIVDNASSDGTQRFLLDFARRHANVRVIFNPDNRAVGTAVNQGFEISQGRFLHRMDNDIAHHAGWAERVLQSFEAFPLLGQVCPLKVLGDYMTQVHSVDEDFAIAFSIRNVTGGSNVIRRELWDRGFRHRDEAWSPGGIGEDYWVSQDIAEMGYDFAWFATDEYGIDLGHDPAVMVDDVDYHIDTYARRGLLPLLAQRLVAIDFDLGRYLEEHPRVLPEGLTHREKLNHMISNARIAWRDWLDGKVNPQRYRPKAHRGSLRISAVMPAFSEADVIYWAIQNLITQGISVHVFASESSRETKRVVAEFPSSVVSMTNFVPVDRLFNERVSERRIMQALHRLEAHNDWLIKVDADEILEAPFPEMGLREGIELAHSQDFNCIGVQDSSADFKGNDSRPGAEEAYRISIFKVRSGIFYLDSHRVSPLANIRLFPQPFISTQTFQAAAQIRSPQTLLY
ncbi:MAG: glycosyltransferase [Candidatus Saganbacteria bacterium]|nr:glycosyltransferase [Candidatus Saganbacteria bacterium]